MEATIKEVVGIEEGVETGHGDMVAFFCRIEGNDGKIGKVRCLAKSTKKWKGKEGTKVEIDDRGDDYEGPDGIEDWRYVGMKTPDDSNSKSRQSGYPNNTRTTTETVTFSKASALYDVVLSECGGEFPKANALFAACVADKTVASPVSDTEEPPAHTDDDSDGMFS